MDSASSCAAIENEMKDIRKSLFGIYEHPPLDADTALCQFRDEQSDKKCDAISSTYSCFCDWHATLIYQLEVRSSNIAGAGYGLFSLAHTCEGDTIDIYAGTVSPFQVKSEGDYLISVKDDYTIDAKARQSCIVRYINHDKANANCRFVHFSPPGKHTHVIVQAIREIDAGEELLVDYGPLFDAHLRL